MNERKRDQAVEDLPLAQAAKLLLEECRMVLPGVQTLFGFQLIAVFQTSFARLLGAAEQVVHLAATLLVALAIALVMTPSAYHRQTRPLEVSQSFVRLCSRLLLWSMFPLMLGICLDLYLVARIITGNGLLSLAAAGLAFAAYGGLWLLLPWRRRRADARASRG